MERSKEYIKKIRKAFGVHLLGIIALITFAVILNRSDIAIEYMKKGLKLCATTVIPSLFPFMVISELLINSPISYKIGKIFKTPMRILFGVSEAGSCAYILGTVCGFPIGARTAIAMYDKGALSKDELSHLLIFCNNPGSAFVISAVGVSIFGSKQLGIIIYSCVILSSITVGIFSNLFSKKSSCDNNNIIFYNISDGKGDISLFTSAVSSSASSILVVCAYVVFFSAFVGCLGSILTDVGAQSIVSTAIFGFFEMTSGVNAAKSLQNPTLAVLMCSAFCAWSGISVHCQIMTICSGREISFKNYFIAKAAQGVICTIMTGICIKFLFPHILPQIEEVFWQQSDTVFSLSTALPCLLFFAASVFPTLFIKRKKECQICAKTF